MPVAAANSFDISAPSSVNVNQKYTVDITYNGTEAGAFNMAVTFVNAECKYSSASNGGTVNCNGGVCDAAYSDPNGIKSGSKILSLSCESFTGSQATFKTTLTGDDAWDIEGTTRISITGKSKVITIKGTTATTKTTTTKSTAPKRTTTSSKKTTKKTPQSTSSTSTTSNTTKHENPTSSSSKTTTKLGVVPTSDATTLKIDLTTSEEATSNTKKKRKIKEEPYSTVASVPDDVKLKSLKIVGYDIAFNPCRINYTIEVDEDVDELYVIAEKEMDSTIVDNTGVVQIDGVKEFIIHVSSTNSDEQIDYHIKVNTKNQGSISIKIILIIIGCFLLILIIFRVLKEIKKVKKEDIIIESNKINSTENAANLDALDKDTSPILLEPMISTKGNDNPNNTKENEDMVPAQYFLDNGGNLSDSDKKKIDEQDENWLNQNVQTDEEINRAIYEANSTITIEEMFANDKND